MALKLVQYKKDQQELQEFLGCDSHDYNLVVALENGNPVEGKIVRDRFTSLCKNNGFEVVVFHSLRHLSTGYKLKLTNGDIKSVQGDTGHAEAEMVTDVYSEIIDEDRRLNAQKMDEQFYGVANVEEKEQKEQTLQNDIFLGNLIDFLKDKENREQLQALLNQVKD